MVFSSKYFRLLIWYLVGFKYMFVFEMLDKYYEREIESVMFIFFFKFNV